MQRRVFAGFTALLLLLCCVASLVRPLNAGATPAGYVVNNYEVHVVVNLDNSYLVTEIIDVEFTTQRHGIFRTIPIGSTSGFPAQIRNLTVEGGPFEIERTSNQWTIRIGDPNRFADQYMRYILRYTYVVGDDHIPDFDEFYFNIIGTDWDTSILNVDFMVQLPAPFNVDNLNITAGSYGSIANVGYLTYEVDGTTITGRTVQPLMPGEGITVALGLPEGYFSEVVPRLDWTELIIWVGLALFPLLTAAVIALWNIWRKNDQLFPSVQFYPPDGLSSADVGFILDGVSTPREITSLLIYWAGKGNLNIEESSKRQIFGKSTSFTFTKLKDLDPESSKPYERILFNRLFALGDGTKVTSKELENKFFNDISKAQQGVRAFFTDIEETRIVAKTNTRFMMVAGLIAFICAFPILFMVTPLASIYRMGTLIFMGLAVFLAIVLIILFYLLFKPITDRVHATAVTWVLGIVAGFLAFTISAILIIFPFPSYLAMISVGLAVLATATAAWCMSTPYKRTPLGDDYMGRLLGFKEFLRVAEKDRIEMLLEDNPSYFYDTLPFALVLGVTNIWADKFKDIEMEPPNWYASDAAVPFTPLLFMNSMNSSLNTMSNVATSSPAQSGGTGGGGGGGFSGGGFGGGGGGSW